MGSPPYGVTKIGLGDARAAAGSKGIAGNVILHPHRVYWTGVEPKSFGKLPLRSKPAAGTPAPPGVALTAIAGQRALEITGRTPKRFARRAAPSANCSSRREGAKRQGCTNAR
jgi:hypothetical protein